MTASEESSESTQSSRPRGSHELPVPPGALREPLPTPAEPTEAGVPGDQPSTATSVGSGGTVEHRAKFSESAHQYIREYIRLADQKATFFFTGATALLAFLYNKGVSERWLKPVMTWNILDTIAFFAMTALALGAFLSLLVVIPRRPGSRRGYLFWEAIAEYENGRQYADELATLTPATLAQIKAEHCFDLSRVCRMKYRMLRVALWIGAVGLAGSLLVFLLL